MKVKKIKIVAFSILATVMILNMFNISVYADLNHAGTQADPYEIGTAEELLWFANKVNSGDSASCAKLTADIDLSTFCGADIGNWVPIGTSDKSYTGIFNGQCHTVSNLYFDINTALGDFGLFGVIGAEAKITDTAVEDAYIDNTFTIPNDRYQNKANNIGFMAGRSFGSINHCSAAGVITSDGNNNKIGGICGYSLSTSELTNCSSNVAITAIGGNICIGGLCGDNRSNNVTTGCLCTGSVNVTGTDNHYGPVLGARSDCLDWYDKNNYYLDTEETDNLGGTTYMTEAYIKSGELAYLMNNKVTDGTQLWYQDCGVGYPEISGKTVYKYTNCASSSRYTNDSALADKIIHEDFIDGICSECGEYFLSAEIITAENRSEFGFSDSTYDGYYAISNYGQLMWFAALVNGDTTLTGGAAQNTAANAVLADDITIDNRYTPIATYPVEYIGQFDGQGHTVTFSVTAPPKIDRYGIFGTTTTNAKISNLKLDGSITSTDGWTYAGALAGASFATPITNVISTVDIENKKSTGYTGGLVGNFGGRDKSVMNYCGVSADITGTANVGGIIGAGWDNTQYYIIKNCYYLGNVKSTTESTKVGAIVGYSETYNSNYYDKVTIQNVYYSGVDKFVGSWKSPATEAAAQISNVNKVSANQFTNGSVAWLLNTAGKNSGDEGYTHTGIWSQGAEYPIFANETDKAVYKVTLDGQADYLSGTYSFPNEGEKTYIISGNENIYNKGDMITLSKDIIITSYSTEPKIESATNSSAMIYAPNAITATLIFAAYKDGKLISVDIQENISITQGEKAYPPTASFNADGADKVAVMLWEDLDSMKPLCEAATANQSQN